MSARQELKEKSECADCKIAELERAVAVVKAETTAEIEKLQVTIAQTAELVREHLVDKQR